MLMADARPNKVLYSYALADQASKLFLSNIFSASCFSV